MKRKNVSIKILILTLSLLFTACGTRQAQIILPADFKGPKELSRLYGVRITPNDNIFLYNEGAHWLGTRYRSGGLTKAGVDCSALVMNIYREIYGKRLQRTVSNQLQKNCRKIAKRKLQEGDLVFFYTGRGRKKTPIHVGIYLKNGRFLHASSSKGVIVSNLNEPYYLRTWVCGGRVK